MSNEIRIKLDEVPTGLSSDNSNINKLKQKIFKFTTFLGRYIPRNKTKKDRIRTSELIMNESIWTWDINCC